MFQKAHNFNIEKIEVSGQNTDPLKELCQNIAAGALLNSNERSDAPKCHPETRVAVQQDIFGWVTDNDHPDTAQPREMLLLTGPAGSGKTTIMNTIGEQLQKDGRLAAAFFFSSFAGSLERSTKGRFVTTLAYQLIQHKCFRGIREHVLSLIADDPAILSMHLRKQMEVLVLEPLRKRGPIQCDAPPSSDILLVDGLDECGQIPPANCVQAERNASRLSREHDQTEILQILLDALKDPAFPFRLVIASRPEPAIRHFFSTSAQDHSVEIFLDNKYNPGADIKLYLTSHFSRIRRKHTYLLPSWPGEEAISTLVGNASGQMIHAATVIRFVETPSNPPDVQLELVLKSGISSGINPSNPFGPLDALYAQILNSSPDPMLALKWLKVYHRFQTRYTGLCPPTWAITGLCESSRGEAEHLFGNMAALVRVDRPGGSLVEFMFYHKSFQDFLGDALRHSAFFKLEEEEVIQWMLSRLVKVMERKGPAVPVDSDESADLFRYEVMHLWDSVIAARKSLTQWYDERLVACDTSWCLDTCTPQRGTGFHFMALMFVVSHNKCSPFLPCRRDCVRWRKAILAEWERARQDGDYYVRRLGSFTVFLDEYGIKRLRPCDIRPPYK